MAKLYDIVAVTGEYQTRDGQTKKRYTNIGAVFDGKYGMSIKLESIPVGWDGWASMYEPKAQSKQTQDAANSRSSGAGDFDANSDIPFN